MSNELRRLVDEGPLTGFQIAAVATCVALNMLDGFDALAMSFAASGVKAEWRLPNTELGYLLSAGLVGMGLGALVLGPCADRWGRRRVILCAVAIAAAGMLVSAVARGFGDLVLLRAVTGVGVGGTIASVAVIVSEYSPQRWRRVALGTYATGYSIGATLGGLLAAYAIPRHGWRSAFVIGGSMTLVMLPVAWRRLPESLDFLVARRPARALEQVNALLGAMRRTALAALPDASAPRALRTDLALVLRPVTVLLWMVFFCTMAGFYFIVSWTPRLLQAAGLSSSHGLTGGVLLNLGGIAGCALYAVVVARADAHRLLLAVLLASAAATAAMSAFLDQAAAALAMVLLLGIITNAAMAGLYAVGPPLYPAQVRGTGMGWALGVGRLGAILAPLAAGILGDRGWSPRELYLLFAAPLVVAALATLLLGPA
ncbi:MAG: MFS transporter, partial [Proteobacteria bacterium]|nr:MFS transporter [Pseudomonadota bacterium]